MINPAKTCAVTGHRIIFDLDRDKLKQTFINIIQDGYDTFLDGFAVGFDTVCFDILTEIKKKKDKTLELVYLHHSPFPKGK